MKRVWWRICIMWCNFCMFLLDGVHAVCKSAIKAAERFEDQFDSVK